ncbi:unnamed protein product [Paramecium octaurelia]|uniref:Uncharacterized protein n=1 Tax=Paramecium octaurelia TaxID=43137 RepID=A0A8S1RYK0_PAROT|nr:unnamed protein product [Paramecium octaurelia]
MMSKYLSLQRTMSVKNLVQQILVIVLLAYQEILPLECQGQMGFFIMKQYYARNL